MQACAGQSQVGEAKNKNRRPTSTQRPAQSRTGSGNTRKGKQAGRQQGQETWLPGPLSTALAEWP